ncbi:MAG: translation elongation factor 4 [Anaerolineales bacterium]|nr:translation elongation factor 4 [Anaerolineales bacterium]
MNARLLMDSQHIRNFCIIAHIDHGKSTLADRLLELTGTVSARDMADQLLDSMELEREKGVTIKSSAVRMMHRASDGQEYELNLIDTPGHVDFTYEVSRSLAACEGVLLVVDAAQGVEAQTLANLYLALDFDLTIIPVVNKIDLASADPEGIAQEIEDLTGIDATEALYVSAKDGRGIDEVLEAIIRRIPAPIAQEQKPLRALIFDSHYDSYKGVIAYVKVVEGKIARGDRIYLMAKQHEVEPLEIGVFVPAMEPIETLIAGEVGYIATGLKEVSECSVGDTITLASDPADSPLAGYRPAKPMVFAGFYPSENDDYKVLRDSLEKLQLNDASLTFAPETSQALGFGFRCGFLGLFHMDIIQERLEREYGLHLVATAPSVEYQILTRAGEVLNIDNPADLPSEENIEEILEPWMKIQIFTPKDYIGPLMDMVTKRRGEFEKMEYLDEKRVLLTFQIPLNEILVDFYDQLKSCSRGYASLDYSFAEYRSSDMVRLEVLVGGTSVDALSVIVHRDQAYHKGQTLVSRMKKVIPRQLFDVAIQAAVGNRVISRANVKALRKNVLAKCYGGDVSRKRKLLEKQKEGKKRMKRVGNVDIPQEAFMAVLSLEE